MSKSNFSKRPVSTLTVKSLQDQFPDKVLGVNPLNKGKMAVTIPNGRVVFDNNNK